MLALFDLMRAVLIFDRGGGNEGSSVVAQEPELAEPATSEPPVRPTLTYLTPMDVFRALQQGVSPEPIVTVGMHTTGEVRPLSFACCSSCCAPALV